MPLGGAANLKIMGPYAGPHPEPDWNCLNTELAGTGLRAIMPNDEPLNPARVREMLRLTKALAVDTMFVTEGPVGAALASGELFGVEFDVFTDDNGIKPDWETGQCLPILGRLMGFDQNNEYVELGVMYCFDYGQFWARALGLGAAPHKVWMGPVIHTSGGGSKSLSVSGNSNEFYGDLRSNGTIRLGGSGNLINDDVYYGGGIELHGGPVFGGAAMAESGTPLWQAPQDWWTYEQQAVGAGTSFVGDVSLVNDGAGGLVVEGSQQPVDGEVVYATGSITVEGTGITASVTLIAEGSVYLSNGDSTLQAAVDDILAVSLSGQVGEGIYLTGSSNEMTGSLFVPAMAFRLFGSDNVITGSVNAKKVKLLGSDNLLDDGTRVAIP